MNDLDLELLAFLGTDLGAWVSSEIGSDAVRDIFMAGAAAQFSVIANSMVEELEREIAESDLQQKSFLLTE